MFLPSGRRLPGDDQHRSADGEPVQSSLRPGACERRPGMCIRRAQTGSEEAGDGDALGSSQLDTLLRARHDGRIQGAENKPATARLKIKTRTRTKETLFCEA